MVNAEAVAVYVGPRDAELVVAAVTAAGGTLVPIEQAEVVIWTDGDPARLPSPLPRTVRWVQLPSAGVERWQAMGVIDEEHLWTSAAEAYAPTVAEHALALLLAGLHHLATYARRASWEPEPVLAGAPPLLRGARVGILGAGGIGRATMALLEPFAVEIWAVTRRGDPLPGVARTLDAGGAGELFGHVDHVVVAAPATAATRHIVGAAALSALPGHAVLVNVARGPLVDTEALVAALAAGEIGAAALDVTDPEPLPAGHPLWSEPRALITPHVANPAIELERALARRVGENLTRWRAGESLLGVIDLKRGY